MQEVGSKMETEYYLELIRSISDNIIDIIGDSSKLAPILELGSDILDTSIPGFKIALELTGKIRIYKFKSFLQGINEYCLKNDIIGKYLSEKLVQLSKKKLFKEYIYQTYESAVNAKSIKNTAILGYYMAKNAFLKNDINIIQIIICNALKELTDIETEIFMYIYNNEYKKSLDDKEYFNTNDIKTKIHDQILVELTVEQLKNLRILGRGIGSFEYSEQQGVCIFTDVTHEFYKLLIETNIIDK
jgi:hypothetical protein